MKIIGITGTLGAGKGTIVEYLTAHHGFLHFSVRQYLIKIIEQNHEPVNRDTMVTAANNLRAKHGPSFIAEELYKEGLETGQDCIIESIRTLGEVNALQSKGNFTLLAIDANSKIRYQRITGRGSETDAISFDTFIQNEAREMTNSDPNKQNLSACMQQANYILTNNGSVEELNQSLDAILKKL